MKIPIFVSCPTTLNESQQVSKDIIFQELDLLMLEPRTLGTTDYPSELPLREVYVLGTHCSGAVILGFEQAFTVEIIEKRGTEKEKVEKNRKIPSPWNQLEAGILFGLGLPLLVFREGNIQGGVFDPGVSDVFVQPMPIGEISTENRMALRGLLLKWQTKVRELYYRDRRTPYKPQ